MELARDHGLAFDRRNEGLSVLRPRTGPAIGNTALAVRVREVRRATLDQPTFGIGADLIPPHVWRAGPAGERRGDLGNAGEPRITRGFGTPRAEELQAQTDRESRSPVTDPVNQGLDPIPLPQPRHSSSERTDTGDDEVRRIAYLLETLDEHRLTTQTVERCADRRSVRDSGRDDVHADHDSTPFVLGTAELSVRRSARRRATARPLKEASVLW